ncbi:MAG TPA: hypothetical protein VN457_01010, partial [Chlamydiales bacterium]|nr:hypothetical protein [Chlamydiales bacterium]
MDKRFFIFLIAITFTFWGIRTASDYYKAKEMSEWLEEHPEMREKLKQQAEAAKVKTEGVKEKKAPFETTAAEPLRFTVDEQKKKSQELYVLENSFQQIVFSNVGAAVVELNLPFQNREDKKSVVLPIEFDRLIRQESPENDLFPLQPAKMADG